MPVKAFVWTWHAHRAVGGGRRGAATEMIREHGGNRPVLPLGADHTAASVIHTGAEGDSV